MAELNATARRNITIDFDTCMNHPKKLTSDFHRLDVRELAREGFMTPGYTFPWRVGSGAVVHIDVAHDARIYLRRGSFVRTICTQQSKCHFGGERLWWTCPQCGNRCAVLHGDNADFACRACKRLTYATQKERAPDRAFRRANRTRRTLGWPPGVMHGIGPKPLGMRWATFDKLLRTYNADVVEAFSAFPNTGSAIETRLLHTVGRITGDQTLQAEFA